MFCKTTYSSTSNTIESVSSGYRNTENRVEKTRSSRFFLNRLRNVCILDETVVQEFEIAFQTINNSWRLKFKAKSRKFLCLLRSDVQTNVTVAISSNLFLRIINEIENIVYVFLRFLMQLPFSCVCLSLNQVQRSLRIHRLA